MLAGVRWTDTSSWRAGRGQASSGKARSIAGAVGASGGRCPLATILEHTARIFVPVLSPPTAAATQEAADEAK